MNLKIYKLENEKLTEFLGELKVKKGLKKATQTDKAIEYLQEKYNCIVRKRLVTGKMDFTTGIFTGGYILFGDNLPFRQIAILEG